MKTQLGKDWKVKRDATSLEKGSLVENREVEDPVKDQEVASLMKVLGAANAVKGPEVVIEGHALESLG